MKAVLYLVKIYNTRKVLLKLRDAVDRLNCIPEAPINHCIRLQRILLLSLLLDRSNHVFSLVNTLICIFLVRYRQYLEYESAG